MMIVCFWEWDGRGNERCCVCIAFVCVVSMVVYDHFIIFIILIIYPYHHMGDISHTWQKVSFYDKNTHDQNALADLQQSVRDSVGVTAYSVEDTHVIERFFHATDARQRMTILADILDAWWIPLDGVIGVIPVIADFWPNIFLGAHALYRAQKSWLSKRDTAKVIGRYLLDATVGSFSFLGDIIDAYLIKANQKVAAIFAQHHDHLALQVQALSWDKNMIERFLADHEKLFHRTDSVMRFANNVRPLVRIWSHNAWVASAVTRVKKRFGVVFGKK